VITSDPPRARRRIGDLVAVTAACEAVATAAWLIPASVHIVNWPPSGPVRVALLPPVAHLGWLLLAGAAVSVALVRRTTADQVAPLLALWLWTLPFLPWIADRIPLLLLLAGPLRWLVAGSAAGLVTVRWFAPALRELPRRLGHRSVFAASLAVYLSFGMASAIANGPRGDEPHYLIITSSLLRDGDLRIENNHRRGDYRAYYADALPPDYLKRGTDGQIYSIHAPGLAALLLPAYAVAGYLGSVAFMAVIASLAATAVFIAAEVFSGRGAAILTWAAVCLTMPFIPHSWLLFPEMAAALPVAWAVLWIVRRDRASNALWLARGAALSILPWLHTKFVVLLALFAGATALALVRRRSALAAFLVPIVASIGLWLYFFHAIYGVADPQIPYGAFARQFVRNGNILHGVIGFLFDRTFGLVVYSPVYVMAIGGAWAALRRRDTRWTALFLAAAAASFVLASARFYMFWGGASAPARFLVPALPCLAPLIALAFDDVRSGAWRGLAFAALAISVTLAVGGSAFPGRLLLFSEPHGRARLLEAVAGPAPLAALLPSLTEPDWFSQLGQLTPWLLALAAAGTVAVLASARARRAWPVAIAASMAFIVVAGVTTARPSAAVREATAARGIADALAAADDQQVSAFDYTRLSRADADRFRQLTTLSESLLMTGSDYATTASTVAAGRYDVQIWFNSLRPRDGEILVTASRARLGAASGTLQNPTILPVEVPANTRNFMVRIADKAVGAAVTAVRLVPLGPLRDGLRPSLDARAIESLPGRDHAYVVYPDEHTYPEGASFWTRGTRRAQVWIAPAGAARMTLTISTGPLDGEVFLETPAGPRTLHIPGGQQERATFELPPTRALVPVEVQSSTLFLPTDEDPRSRDTRPLGCRVEIALE
jgi:hypothetical protein